MLLKLSGQSAIAFVCFHPGGDVDDLGDEVLHPAVLVADTADREITPDPMTVGVDVLLDPPVGVDAACQQVIGVLAVLLQELGDGQFLPGLALQGLGFITE